MRDYFLRLTGRFGGLSHLQKLISRFRGVRTKKRNILIFTILIIATGLFFSIFLNGKARANQAELAKGVSPEVLDPMNKIGKGLVTMKVPNRNITPVESKVEVREAESSNLDIDTQALTELVKDHPMVEMVPFISKRDKRVAAFLVGIAKKESNWGLHSPTSGGKDCHNYWGYKGNYNPSPSGYSCFDSAEQAVSVVGDRIEDLINKNIDTPEKMLVWKCGSSCKSHDPAGVKSWVATVRTYWQKMI
jgi:hypothetical protein